MPRTGYMLATSIDVAIQHAHDAIDGLHALTHLSDEQLTVVHRAVLNLTAELARVAGMVDQARQAHAQRRMVR